jgi:hypothetical protein
VTASLLLALLAPGGSNALLIFALTLDTGVEDDSDSPSSLTYTKSSGLARLLSGLSIFALQPSASL